MAGLTYTEFADGWYVPSCAELYKIWENKATIQTSLDAVGGFYIGTDSYWSSSQEVTYYSYACDVYFSDGYVDYCCDFKHYDSNVLVVQAFNYQQFSNSATYESPSIKDISLSKTVISENSTEEISVTITGNNFDSPLYRDIVLTGGTFGDLVYVDETTLTTTVSFDGTGTKTIEATYGTTTVSTNVEILFSFSVGDVLLSDGTRIKAKDVSNGITDEQYAKAIAVVAYVEINSDGVAQECFGVGLQRSSSTLQWAPYGTTGYQTNFTGIQGYGSHGDTDGSDNWEYICSIDPEGSADAATNYPVFNYANNYGAMAGLTYTEFADGWYVPTLIELREIYSNKSTIQNSLDTVDGFVIGSSNYWSSTQSSSSTSAYYKSLTDASFDYNYEYSTYKYYTNYVLVLKAFNYQQFSN